MSVFFWRVMILGITATTFMAAGAACGDDDEPTATDGKVRVVTTLPLFADFVREVGGGRVDVDSLLPSGADPHTWEPAPQDVARVEDADLILVSGTDLEGEAVKDLIQDVAGDDRIADVSEASLRSANLRSPTDTLADDPHFWMSIDHADVMVAIIVARLGEQDPGGAEYYSQNYESYSAELTALGEYMKATVSEIPPENRKLITTHDAFGYLAEYLGFEITAVVSESPGQDTSPGDIEAIINAIEDAGVPAVFTEPQVSGESDVLEQVADDTGAMVCTLYSDAFDDEIDTYIEMMRFNADELARCLGGDDGG